MDCAKKLCPGVRVKVQHTSGAAAITGFTGWPIDRKLISIYFDNNVIILSHFMVRNANNSLHSASQICFLK